MRWRRPLAASAAVALAALATLALTTRPGQTAVVTTEIPVSVTADCGALGESMTIHLSAKTLSPGYNQVVVTQKNVSRETIASVLVADDGTLDADVTMPVRKNNGIYVIYLNGNSSLREGIGYFSVPCPTIAVTPTCGPADDGSGARYALTITGTAFGPPPTAPGDRPTQYNYPGGGAFLPVHIEVDGSEVAGSPVPVADDGTIDALITPSRLKPGPHTFHAYQWSGDAPRSDSAVSVSMRDTTTGFTVPCATTTTTPTTQSTPTTAPTTATTAPTTAPTTPTTAPATTRTKPTQTTTTPTTPVTAALSPTCLEPSANGTSSVQVTGGGFSPGAVDVLLDGDVATKAAADGDGNVAAEIELTPGAADRSITVRQGSRQADVTLRIPCASHPRLILDPAIGPPGFVTTASGSGFPPNTRLVLAWSPGIGTRTVQTDDRGAFAVSMLVFPDDQTGARVLRATPVEKGRFGKVDANFLCVPGTVQRPQAQTFDFRR